MFSLSGEDLPVVVAEAELKKKTENKTKEDSLICPLNYIPPQGNAPKKRKENRVFHSPESYTSFQKCSASIYWARKSCFTTLLQHWNTKPWNFLLTSSALVSSLIIMILTLMFAVFSRRLLQSSKFFLSVLVKYFIVSTRECRDKSSLTKKQYLSIINVNEG